MSNQQTPEPQEQAQPEPDPRPEPQEEEQTQPEPEPEPSARRLYQRAVEDIEGLPILGRIALAIFVIILLWKMTPLLDLLWIFIQLFVIPCTLLIALGVMSHGSYMLVIGWLNESLKWTRAKAQELQG